MDLGVVVEEVATNVDVDVSVGDHTQTEDHIATLVEIATTLVRSATLQAIIIKSQHLSPT